MNNLTEVKKDWKSIPYFKQYTPTKYYAILGCFVVGFRLEAVNGWNKYRPYFVTYLSFTDFTRHFFSSLAGSVDIILFVLLNR